MKNEEILARFMNNFRKYMYHKNNKKFLDNYVLMTIHQNDIVTPQFLIKELNITAQTLSNVLKKLESKNLIKRSINSNDKRIINIECTKIGIEKSKELKVYFFKKLSSFLDFLGKEDTEKLFYILERIEDYVKKV